MPAIFEHSHIVQPSEIDRLGHVNNLEYLKWMLAAAVAHSTDAGWPSERHLELGSGWVVRAHRIEYLQPAFHGNTIVVRTWIADFKKVTSLRKYQIVRTDDGVLLAKAETNWAYIDYRRNLPRRIPQELLDSFELVACDPGV